MSIETNKALLYRIFDAIAAGDLAALDGHPGFWETRQVMPGAHQRFGNWRNVATQQIAEGDKVFTYGTTHFTHTGVWGQLAPTHKRVTIEVMSLDQVKDGVVAQHNSAATWPDVFHQIGVPSFAQWPARDARLITQSPISGAPDVAANKAAVQRLPYDLTHGKVSSAALQNGLGALRAHFEHIHIAFPDLEASVVDQVAEGELVGTRATLRGTQRGPLFSFAPTGVAITWDQYLLNRVVNGAVVEHVGIIDWGAALAQLGYFPSPEVQA
jgi:predicted ester cyclase